MDCYPTILGPTGLSAAAPMGPIIRGAHSRPPPAAPRSTDMYTRYIWLLLPLLHAKMARREYRTGFSNLFSILKLLPLELDYSPILIKCTLVRSDLQMWLVNCQTDWLWTISFPVAKKKREFYLNRFQPVFASNFIRFVILSFAINSGPSR